MPKKIWQTRVHYGLVYLVSFALIYASYFICVAEFLFWEEFSSRFNFIAVDYLVYRHEVSQNIQESYPVIWILGVILIFSLGTLALAKPSIKVSRYAKKTNFSTTFLLLCLPVVSYIALNQQSHQISQNRYLNELAANGPYQFVAAFRNNELKYQDFYLQTSSQVLAQNLQEEIKSYMPSSHWIKSPGLEIRHQVTPPNHPLGFKNLVLVTVESLSADFLGYFGNPQGLTPNLDQLASSGIVFSNTYATGSRTTRGLEAISLSIPPTPGRSLVKRPEQTTHYSIGSEFIQRGYDTKFFYGGRGYFDNMNSFFSHNGFRILDQTDLREEEIGFSNAWGVADEFLYHRLIKEANQDYQKGKNFFYYVMTTSNHRPYTFPKGRIDLPTGSREAAVKYTDWAIGDFITQAQQQPWFDDTLFVFIADHCASSAGRQDLEVSKHHIPWIMYAPKKLAPQDIQYMSSQIDVAPSIYALFGFKYTSQFFGYNVFSAKETPQLGRALIANYQYLGLLQDLGNQGTVLTYLKPQAQVTAIKHPRTQAEFIPTENWLVQRLLAYYQGAAELYEEHKLNWKLPYPVELRY
ncbi:LTA synthase family protein [Allopseudospirillum japonicum]|nr:LTA synthase family protein [Allopseudospirillum japonicum]